MARAASLRLHCYALLLVLVILPKPNLAMAISSPHRALLQTCQPKGSIPGKSGDCKTDNGSECCKDGQPYATFACSPPVTGRTRATLTLNSFARNKDGGGPSECTGTFFPDDRMVVALSTGWYAGGSRCNTSIMIRTAGGSSATAMVVDECDSLRGCDKEHNFEPPCANNIVDGSPAVWKKLGLDTNVGEVPITWTDA